MTDIVEQLRTHDDARLYAEADLLMAEAADEIEARDAEIERNREAIAELVEALKLVEQWLQGWGSAEIYIDMLRAAITKHDTTTKGNQ